MNATTRFNSHLFKDIWIFYDHLQLFVRNKDGHLNTKVQLTFHLVADVFFSVEATVKQVNDKDSENILAFLVKYQSRMSS